MTDQQAAAGTAGPEPPPGGRQRRRRLDRQHWPALIARLPRLFWRPAEDETWDNDWPVISPQTLEDYPWLRTDLAVWPDQFERRFRQLDHRAQILQNRFWRQRVLLIGGGLLATSLATVQAARGGGHVWLAVIQAVLTGLLAGLAVLLRSRRAQYGYLSARLKAERIKSEFYLFLARAGDYAHDDRVARLGQAVDDIEAAEGVS
jgi:Protein of unknown function (DUF4231)